MKFIVKLFPEIMIKRQKLYKRSAKILTSNIHNILQKYDEETQLYATGITGEVRSKMKENHED